MNFDISKEDWKRELRSKSPIYATCDENKNLCTITKRVEDNDTDTDSGLTSIDGDTPRDMALCNNLLEHDKEFTRQDSGVSSENSDISSPYLRSYKDQQVFRDIATKNKPLSRSDNIKQVRVNGIPALHQYSHSKQKFLQKTISSDFKKLKGTKCVENIDKNDDDRTDELVDENRYPSKNASDKNGKIKKSADGGKVFKKHGDKNEGKHNRLDEYRHYSSSASYYDSKEDHHEKLKEDKNNNISERNRETKTTDRNKRGLRNEKSMQNGKEKSQYCIARDELYQSYKETADKVTETVDQLLYKDLMCAYLTEEILNFSNSNFSVEDEMLVIEERFLEDQIFNSVSLLQTMETITEQQHVELKIVISENRRMDIEIKERILKLQHMERAFRNMKFKHAPKQLKRYCSVESLLSDSDHNDIEKKTPCDTIWDEEEEFTEEISLV